MIEIGVDHYIDRDKSGSLHLARKYEIKDNHIDKDLGLNINTYIRKNLHHVFRDNNIPTANKARSGEKIYSVSRNTPLDNPFDFTLISLHSYS